MKIALISETLPPAGTGQATVIRRMLEGLDPARYCLVSNRRYDEEAGRLPGVYHHLPAGFQLTRGHRFGLARLRRLANIPLSVAQQARRLTRLLRRERCDAVVACTGEVTHLPAGYLASRRLGLPFYAYIFDDYSYREWADPAAAFWARRLEPRLFRNAAGVIVPNEVLRDDLRRRHGVETTVIHNSFDIAPYEAAAGGHDDAAAPRADGEVRIVYTGDIYEAHYDAFRNLLLAIERMGRAARLHVYTTRPIDELEKYGIRGPLVRHPYRSQAEIPRVQREADLLFLPLAFDSPYPDLVRTSATTKLGEYLAAGRPVLAHAPGDSFVSWYFRQHGCGVVVDRPEVPLLAEAIETTLDDPELRRRLCERAWECAREDFSIAKAREMFWQLLGARPPARA